MKPLEITTVPCGTGFIVGDGVKNTIFLPGSVGFMKFVLGQDNTNPNIFYYNVVFTRRGKSGKRRFEEKRITAPIFKLPDVPLELYNKDWEKRENFLDIKADYLNTKPLKYLEPGEGKASKDEKFDFLIRLFTVGSFLKELDENGKAPKNDISDEILNGGFDYVRHAILELQENAEIKKFINDINDSHTIENYDEEFLTYMDDTYLKNGKGIQLINLMNKAQSSLVIYRLNYEIKIIGALEKALNFVSNYIKAEKPKNSKELMERAKLSEIALGDNKKHLEDVVETRMKCILKNRDTIIKKPSAKVIKKRGKLTHVFAGI